MDLFAPTSPNDCGLAIAIPLDRDEFIEALQGKSTRDFPRWYASQRGGRALRPEAIWESFWEREGSRIVACAEDVRSRGVEVVYQASLSAIACLARRKTVVTVLAHWHSGLIEAEHIRDARTFLKLLRETLHPVVSRLYGALPGACRVAIEGAVISGALDCETYEHILSDINCVLQTRDLTREGAEPNDVWPSPGYHLLEGNRSALEQALPDILVGATGIDLFDGTFRADDVATTIGEEFSGLLDLAVCRSMFLAEQIRRHLLKCRAIANTELTTVLFRALLHRETIREIDRAPAPFASVTEQLRRALAERSNTS
jgi:hypothetical protein